MVILEFREKHKVSRTCQRALKRVEKVYLPKWLKQERQWMCVHEGESHIREAEWKVKDEALDNHITMSGNRGSSQPWCKPRKLQREDSRL
jgi:hypothetical protein